MRSYILSIALFGGVLAAVPAAAADNPISAAVELSSALERVKITEAKRDDAYANMAELVTRFDVLDREYRNTEWIDWDYSAARREALRIRKAAQTAAIEAGEVFYAANFEHESALRALDAVKKKQAGALADGANVSRSVTTVPASGASSVSSGASRAGTSR